MSQTNGLKSTVIALLVAITCIVGGVQAGKWFAQRDVPHASPPRPSYTEIDNGRYLLNSGTPVVLYSQEGCVASPKVKEWLQKTGITYEERVVERGNAHWNDIQAMQVKLMPVLLTRDAKIEGFDPRILEALRPLGAGR